MKRLVVDLMSTVPHMRLPDAARERLLADTLPGWETVIVESSTISAGDGTNRVSDETLRVAAIAEAYFGFGVPAPLIEGAPVLRWAHSASAGVGNSISQELRDSEITLTNSAGIYGEPMADTVLAGVLHFTRALDVALSQQAASKWDQGPFTALDSDLRELDDLRVLVIGAGGIGSAVARRFTALGAECTGVRRRPELGVPEGFSKVAGPDEIDALLPTADVVVISAPLTSETRTAMDEQRFALLPEGAIVVNVARGGLVDENALTGALDKLRGAVLDVFEKEPLPASSPLWSHPRVLITPHVSGVSPRRHWPRALELFQDNWKRWDAGLPLRNVVDLEAGY